MILHFLCKNSAAASFTIRRMATTADPLGMPEAPGYGSAYGLDPDARHHVGPSAGDDSAATGRRGADGSKSPKYECPVCEDFGLIVGEDGLGTSLCKAEGCPAAARLKAQGTPSADAPESRAPAPVREPRS